MGLIEQSILNEAIFLAEPDKMLTQAISRSGQHLNNKLQKQGKEHTVDVLKLWSFLQQHEATIQCSLPLIEKVPN